ncbi:hypothetical protein J6590_077620 [Homalodisca vitripennis]|nr:hypothetical protein J6590_077620 [Homalodisca vitripennis]
MIVTDPYEVIRLFPMLLPQQARDDAKTSVKVVELLEDMDLESGLLALIEYLTEENRERANSTELSPAVLPAMGGEVF